MDAARLIASLVNLERTASKRGDLATRDLVLEMQDWVLQMQRENLDFRRDNQILRLRVESMRPEPASSAHAALAAPPFAFHAIALRNRQRMSAEAAKGNESETVALAPAV